MTYTPETLEQLRLPELQQAFEAVTGQPTRAPNRAYLMRTILASQPDAQAQAEEQEITRQPAESGHPTPETTEEPMSETEPQSTSEETDATVAVNDSEPEPGAEKLTKLSVEELRALYVEVVGRPTKSEHRGYLMWKIRQAQRGAVPVGPSRRGSVGSGIEHKVIPLRLPLASIEALDTAWQRLGVPSRTEFFRLAVAAYLSANGEEAAAAQVTTGAG